QSQAGDGEVVTAAWERPWPRWVAGAASRPWPLPQEQRNHEEGPAMPALLHPANRRSAGSRIAATRVRTLSALAPRACVARRPVARARLAVRTMRGLARRTLSALALSATTVLRDRRVEADRLARREAGDRVHHDLGLQHPLDLVEQAALFRRHQRQRFARGAVSAGAADAVH